MTITDFDAWLASNGPETAEEAFQLYHAVESLETNGIYTVERKGQQVFFQGCGDDLLLLASHKAVDAFRERIEAYCPDPDMGWEGSESFHREMAKDD